MADADTQTEQRAGRISKGKFCWAEAVTHPPWQHMREPSFFSLLTSFCNVLQSPEFRNRAFSGSVLELWWLIWHISGREPVRLRFLIKMGNGTTTAAWGIGVRVQQVQPGALLFFHSCSLWLLCFRIGHAMLLPQQYLLFSKASPSFTSLKPLRCIV